MWELFQQSLDRHVFRSLAVEIMYKKLRLDHYRECRNVRLGLIGYLFCKNDKRAIKRSPFFLFKMRESETVFRAFFFVIFGIVMEETLFSEGLKGVFLLADRKSVV